MIPGLSTLYPPLSPPLTPAEIWIHITHTRTHLKQKKLVRFFTISGISKNFSFKKKKKLSPKFVFTPNLIFFCDLKPHAKYHNPTIAPSRRKVSEAEREKNAVNSGHLVP